MKQALTEIIGAVLSSECTIWRPQGSGKLGRVLLHQLCMMRDRGLITIWQDADEEGMFYEIRPC